MILQLAGNTMRTTKLIILFVFAVFMWADQAYAADEARELARRNTCFNCHSIETDDIGPAWKNVAARYRGDVNAETKLVNKVSRGGKGVWGYLPMPAFASQMKEADIRMLVKYILALK